MPDLASSGMTPFWPEDLTIRGPFSWDGGYPENTRNFIRGLLALGIDVHAIESTGRSVEAWEPWLRPLQGSYARGVVVDFNPPGQVRRAPETPLINYTMFEASALPKSWQLWARKMPATIVPSRHAHRLWRMAGVREERLRVVRHGVDTRRFDGSAPPWFAPTLPDGTPFSSRRVRMLQVFGIGPRKNTAGLLTAWLGATRSDDDAALLLKVAGWGIAQEAELAREIQEAEQRAGKRRAEAAPIVLQRDPMGGEEMPGLYTACTHYISASRGEGWDLGMTEAGASGLTLIAPAHTGYLEYLDSSIATMIPAQEVAADVHPEDILAEFFTGLGWYEPDQAALAVAIRDAVDGRPQAIGAQARIRAAYDVRHAAEELLDAVVALWPEEVARGR